MKRFFITIISFILVISILSTAVFAADANIESFDITIKAPYGNVFDLKDVKFGSNTIFDGDTTQYKHDLAILSAAIASKAGSVSVKTFLKDTLQLKNVCAYDYSRVGLEKYRTGYAYGTKDILRNGKECTLLVIACSTTSLDENGNDSVLVTLDFMNYEMTGEETNFDSRQVLTITECAKLIYDGHDNSSMDIKDVVDNIAQSGKDYVVFVTGQSRGASVGNYLSKMLVDDYGTEHVVSYLISPMNIDKDAVDKNYSKYNCIFNIVHPDDLVTYLPFGPEYGSGWGFARYGVDVVLQCAASASPQLDEAQNSLYLEFIKKNETEGMVYLATDKNYRYDKTSGNGVAIKTLLSNLASVFTKPEDVYKKDVTFNESYLLYYKSITKKFYPFALDLVTKVKTANGDDYLEIYDLAKQTSNHSCDMQTLLNFFLKHFMGYDKFNDFTQDVWLTLFTNITHLSDLKNVIAVREGGTSHFIDAYLSWLLAANNTDANDNFQTINYNVDKDSATVAIAYYDDNEKFLGLSSKEASGRKLVLNADEQAKNSNAFLYNSKFAPLSKKMVINTRGM